MRYTVFIILIMLLEVNLFASSCKTLWESYKENEMQLASSREDKIYYMKYNVEKRMKGAKVTNYDMEIYSGKKNVEVWSSEISYVIDRQLTLVISHTDKVIYIMETPEDSRSMNLDIVSKTLSNLETKGLLTCNEDQFELILDQEYQQKENAKRVEFSISSQLKMTEYIVYHTAVSDVSITKYSLDEVDYDVKGFHFSGAAKRVLSNTKLSSEFSGYKIVDYRI